MRQSTSGPCPVSEAQPFLSVAALLAVRAIMSASIGQLMAWLH